MPKYGSGHKTLQNGKNRCGKFLAVMFKKGFTGRHYSLVRMDRLYELCLRERHEEIDALLASSAFEKRGLAGLIGSEKNFQESLNGFRGASNRTVLHCAVSGMTIHTGLVKAFIQHGADVNAVDVGPPLQRSSCDAFACWNA